MNSATQKRRVWSFWQREPCGSRYGTGAEGTREYFEAVERARYGLEPFIPSYAGFEQAAGRDVLEIGVGLGTDFARFARAGARAVGVDLTPRAVELVKRRLEVEGLEADVQVADAERLPFENGRFDLVYSWGVLHHTPDTEAAIAEAIRVTRPGGRVCIMLYARRSWVAFGLWARYGLLRGRPWLSLTDVVARHMESPGTRAFTTRELRRLFAGLEAMSLEHVGTPYDRRVAGPLADLTGRWLGWFLVVRGRVAGGYPGE
jgi:SAM-dependent methyltransferase